MDTHKNRFTGVVLKSVHNFYFLCENKLNVPIFRLIILNHVNRSILQRLINVMRTKPNMPDTASLSLEKDGTSTDKHNRGLMIFLSKHEPWPSTAE